MIVVLDTNVIVSGVLSPFGPPGRILDLVLSGDVRLAYDDRILAEYSDVLARKKFGFDPAPIADLLLYIKSEGQHVTAVPLKVKLPDPGDVPFLEVAYAARADALVSGNVRHYPLSSRRGIMVLTPADFLAWWQNHHKNHV